MTTTRYAYFTDRGRPVTGATVAFTLTGPTGTVLVNAQGATEEGGGAYSYLLDGTDYLPTAGLYKAHWAGSAAGGDLWFDDLFLVVPPQPGLLTRWELRHLIAAELDDLWLGTSSASSSTSLSDVANRGADPTRHWAGAWLYIYAAAVGRGQERRISAFTTGTGKMDVPAWTNTPDAVGALYELHMRHQVDAYNRAIERAMLAVLRRTFIPIRDETLVQASSTYYYALPSGLAYLSGVESGSDTDGWTALKTPDDWRVIPGQGLHLLSPTQNARVRLLGAMRMDLPRSDDSFIDGPADYLIHEACTGLLAGKMAPGDDPDAHAAKLAYHRDRAKELAPRIQIPNNAVRVL